MIKNIYILINGIIKTHENLTVENTGFFNHDLALTITISCSYFHLTRPSPYGRPPYLYGGLGVKSLRQANVMLLSLSDIHPSAQVKQLIRAQPAQFQLI